MPLRIRTAPHRIRPTPRRIRPAAALWAPGGHHRRGVLLLLVFALLPIVYGLTASAATGASAPHRAKQAACAAANVTFPFGLSHLEQLRLPTRLTWLGERQQLV